MCFVCVCIFIICFYFVLLQSSMSQPWKPRCYLLMQWQVVLGGGDIDIFPAPYLFVPLSKRYWLILFPYRMFLSILNFSPSAWVLWSHLLTYSQQKSLDNAQAAKTTDSLTLLLSLKPLPQTHTHTPGLSISQPFSKQTVNSAAAEHKER